MLAALTGCASLSENWKAPELALVGVRPKALALEQQSFIVRLRVENPNDRTLPLSAMTYRISLEGRELAHGATELERTIPPFGEETVDVEVSSNLVALLPQLSIFALSRDKLRWKISGTVTLASGLFPLPFWYSGEIDPRAVMATRVL
ncbi:MAG: LEA type 2 family protein [Chromatiaceae bacterium]